MSAHKSIDKICVSIVALTVAIAMIFCCGRYFGIETTAHAIGYENRIFDRSKVHTFDIVIDDWDAFLETCESEVYTNCNVIIDGEAVRNVGIRGKGNTSLSSVKNMDSGRYSFKIEFDQYDSTKSYHGLDKLCLNNIIQDNTYMKDYLAYTLMYDFGVDAPLCSFVYITVNGEDWGLYLAVEAIEESFLERNYGSNFGDLYKPDSMSFGGGGPGKGKDFSMGNFFNKDNTDKEEGNAAPPNGFGGEMPDFGGEMPDFSGEMPEGFDPDNFDPSEMFGENGGEMPDFGGKGGGFGMGSNDVKLNYTDDDIDSYSNIFNNAKTTVNTADKKRLISSLKALKEQSDIENTVDVDEVIRYFVVHDFLCNGDSYTGQMIHNYYLYEKDGQLSMIPWDYNLAFGSFMGGQASSSVNSAIDTPVSNGMSDRPMVSWIFDNEEYTEKYHELFSEFLSSVDFEELVSETAALIDEYVEKDPTKFCTYEEFHKGVEAISQFCTLRAESVSGQLDGTIPSTTEGQKADSSSLVDTGDLNISDMGSMASGGGFGGEKKGGLSKSDRSEKSDTSKQFGGEVKQTSDTSDFSVTMLSNIKLLTNEKSSASDDKKSKRSSGDKSGVGGQPPQGFGGNFDPNNMPEGFDPDNMPDFGGGMSGDFDPDNMPEGFDPENMPDDFDPSNMPDGFSGGRSKSDSSETEEKTSDSKSETDDEQKEAPDEKAQSGDEQEKAPSDKADRSGEGRPQMGSFSPMDGGGDKDNTVTYILLGASAIVLLAGLVFAVKFKR